jgi:small GTP-binding protein
MGKNAPRPVRVLAVGDGAVGKTCMLHVFKGDPYPEEYQPTIFENHHELRTYQGKQYLIHLWDTAGQEEYDHLRPASYAKCDVVLICFSLADPVSLQHVSDVWIREVNTYAPKAAIILVGTKSDLWQPSAAGAITQSHIDTVASKTNAVKALVCSAKNNENISGVFELAIAAAIKAEGVCNVA